MQHDELITEFLIESYENLDQLDRDIVLLEEDGDRSRLAGIFRNIHTIKGTCGFLEYTKLEKVAHAGESLLSRLRDNILTVTPEITTALLMMGDAIRLILAHIEETGEEGEEGYAGLVSTLRALTEGQPDHGLEDQSSGGMAHPSKLEQQRPKAPQGVDFFGGGDVAQPKEARPEEMKPREVKSKEAKPTARPTAELHTHSAVSESNIRVDVHLLDKLMNLVGELVLARNQTLQFSSRLDDAGFTATTQRLNLITTELQEGIMKTRMQPIKQVWGKLPRLVRDLALSLGKKVRIEMEGEDTDLDRTLIEAIKDPMTHLVRNSVDHGFECPEERRAAGKKGEGRLFLRAYHEGGQVNIEISDDGKGIDPERIRRGAIEKGLISVEQSHKMSDREAIHLIFAPGFSTAEKVTNVSGRGVGMDVVKTNIEKIGGSIDIASTLGAGTTIKLKIPLTLAIIPALVIRCAGDRYAIPQVSLLELVRLEGKQIKARLESIHGVPVYRLRGRILPLVFLAEELKMPSKRPVGNDNDELLLVVLQAGDQQFGLVVDGIDDTEEIVVKPLGKQLQHLPCFAGAAIMGDGQVALILDILGLAKESRVLAESGVSANNKDSAADTVNLQTLLLFRIHNSAGRFAMPLSMVARLEEFRTSVIERAGDLDVIQYRDALLPLVYLADFFPRSKGRFEDRKRAHSLTTEGMIQVVVYNNQDQNIGLVVEEILDIVNEAVEIKVKSSRTGIEATTVIQGVVTELLSVEETIQMAAPEFFQNTDVA